MVALDGWICRNYKNANRQITRHLSVMNNNIKKFSIGIDPGRNTAIAVYNRNTGKIELLKTTDFWGAYDIILRDYLPDFVHKLVIERPSSNSVWHKMASRRGAIEKTAQNVGSVLREADLLIKRMRDLGYNVVVVDPLGKVNAERFRKITGYELRTNQHERDAGMMVFGC